MSEWKEVELGNLADIKGGKRLPKGKMLVDYKTNHPYIRVSDITNNKIDLNGLLFVEPEVQKTIKRYTVNTGDVILSIVGTIGLVAIIPHVLDAANLTENCVKLKIKGHNLNNRYLYHYLSSKSGQEEIDSLIVGSTQPKFPLYNIKKIKLLLPPLLEQERIAEVFSSLDDKIDLLQRQNKTLEEIAETLFRQWFVEEAEEGSNTGKLGDIIEIYDSQRVPLSSMEREKLKTGILYPYYGAATIMDYINKYIFDGDYLLLGEDGTVQDDDGYPILQRAIGKCWINNHTHVLKGKKGYSNNYLEILLKSTNISHIVTGAVQPKINQADLKELEILNPSVQKVEKFSIIVDPIYEKKHSNLNQIQKLETLRDTLLPKLMSGEVRVSA